MATCFLSRVLASIVPVSYTHLVTTGTVKTHTTHIYRKLDVNSRQELLDQLDAFG